MPLAPPVTTAVRVMTISSLPGRVRAEATVDLEHCAVRGSRRRARKVGDGTCDLFGRHETSVRLARREGGARGHGIGGCIEQPLDPGRVRRAGADGIHTDAFGQVIGGHCARQGGDRPLRRGVERTLGQARVRDDGGHVHNGRRVERRR